MRFSYLLILFFYFNSHGRTSLDDKRKWESISAPDRMLENFERTFSNLPLSGKNNLSSRGWSSDFWARKKGGINYRWNSNVHTGFNLISPTKAQLSLMTLEQLKKLAPSEKYDLLIGRYDYPVKKEVAAYADPNALSWSGICHGWAPAALLHDEPHPKTLLNPDGFQIPFGSADIKALLSWYYAYHFDAPTTHQMGRRCYGNEAPDNEDRCRQDMNAGAFHLVIANRLGMKGLGFVADVDNSNQVWNHDIVRYLSKVTSTNLPPLSTSAPGTVSMVKVHTVINYVAQGPNRWTPLIGTSGQHEKTKTYDYYLDLDSQNRIIGGEWISTQRPDFIWLINSLATFQGLYKHIPDLLGQ